MKPATEKLVVALACAAALAAGTFPGSGRSPQALQAAMTTDGPNLTPGQQGSGSALAKRESMDPITAPGARMILLRRTLAACTTDALWQWLEEEPKDGANIRGVVAEELIDRIGWRAWEQALAISDPGLRERMGDSILYAFACRDPWKALAEWQQHRDIFQSKHAGVGVISQCILASAAISADKTIEMFQQIPLEESQEMMVVAFAKDFDFRKVLDHLVTDGKQPYTAIEDLVPAWAERSPVEAAEWLAAHPEYLEKEYRESEVSGTLRAIARAELDEASRRRALEALATLKPEALDQAWFLIGDGSDGKLTASVLQSADITGQRDEYLRSALQDTRTAGKIDPSWEQVPLAERQQVLALVEQEWAQSKPSPVDAKARARWVKMVKSAWGIAP
ncbi:hypothetical protein [Haloferula sp. BvORR071]|uniref:hypothetical protein n=1 Tax=Haloferula sp. BvORR071 TaxID=1396141 RepID=UPI0005571529|nr:hypothetical protein [Haloferula sp. BvORR071]